jgi:hypothetical protein
MVLSAFLKLDAGAFTTPLGKAVEGVKGFIRIGGALKEHLAEAFNYGGDLDHLARQTGELPGTLAVLRRAFDDTGVGSGQLGHSLALLSRNLSSLSGATPPPAIKNMGLDLKALRSLDAAGQFNAIGKAIGALKSPADQTAAALALFGESGASMLSFLKDKGAIENARASLGVLPGVMNNAAAGFEKISTTLGHLKEKTLNLWVGLAEGLSPAVDAITTMLDKIDWTAIGQKISHFLGTVVEMFRILPLGELVGNGLKFGFGEAVNYAAGLFAKLGDWIYDACAKPFDALKATFESIIQTLMQAVSFFSKGKLLPGFEAQGYDALRDEYSRNREHDRAIAEPTPWRMDLIDTSASRQFLVEGFRQASESFEASLKTFQEKTTAAAPWRKPAAEAAAAPFKPQQQEQATLSDRLLRIGGYIGGQSGAGKMERLGERTAVACEKMCRQLSAFSTARAAWA